MKTIFDTNARAQLIGRIEKLNNENEGQWGKMNVYQMTKHLNIWNQWVLGINKEMPYRQSFLGKLIGKMVLRSNTKNDKPMGKGAPAGSNFTIKEKSGDFEKEKRTLIELTEHYGHYDNPDFIHDFFGKMTKEQIGVFAYKHYDHHLRQFGV
ncbi:DUF1569 domain-containing protein [Zobellia galactanivorans]|uniref:DUF1569 domain-containing protein n=1 Tax=Zobellia galactanivorans (strain DSM 12802 / CCUG 47099 / CIP 106680 / NCIMB 13871 / Dsij) TaxID=63186 RepID=UPI001C06B701|nr:DUF1569 domain-containing protein [Zobellia galactanivorans]MBU3024743.1 DUF1569 domain-containing protein [Zobellia galactanivorans]MDO6810673.1 DUF1569 domain-containing protein [Zobellia galactanivorans]